MLNHPQNSEGWILYKSVEVEKMLVAAMMQNINLPYVLEEESRHMYKTSLLLNVLCIKLAKVRLYFSHDHCLCSAFIKMWYMRLCLWIQKTQSNVTANNVYKNG